MRDSFGALRKARMIPYRACTTEETEGLATLEAIKWAIDMKLKNVTFEGNAFNIIKSLNQVSVNIGWRTKNICDPIKLSSYFECSIFTFAYRSANAVADALVSKAKTSTTDVIWSEPPSFLFDVLTNDSLSVIGAFPGA
ncbi:hypothetical protein BVC80_1365g5 [Macleaya cordata]|uniref:RNase H type-1 domain-containing protein n=1 Tax=Macleaya cordata TaxID=56857 RepID=A0A200QVF7_MACCD|nr:hypothetical protein BVC80_1365g5 [Macleaya cordata]